MPSTLTVGSLREVCFQMLTSKLNCELCCSFNFTATNVNQHLDL